ncbi:hypothetical protein B0H19DRAFT_989151 [Mycena capillaripes]|nr:hypothetical protein B0H19DRAFT_989151 [Mycena capillaripes]
MADTLPDEIISEILAPALKVPEAMFSNLSPKSPFAKYSVSSSMALLVCKAWLRVATPLLYNVVVLRSKAQCRALHAALYQNPDLGRFIKKLRVEGGFGTHMEYILKAAPNITDVFISLQIHSSDSSFGLAAGLPLIDPIRLIIFDDHDTPLKNKAVLQTIDSLTICAKKWTNLNTIVFPYLRVPFAREAFILAMCTSSTLKTISFPSFNGLIIPLLIKIAALPTLEAVEIRTSLKPKSAAPPKSTDLRLNILLRWEDTPVVQRVKPAYKLTARPPVDPTFRPLRSTPQAIADKIWARILFFAMLALQPKPKNILMKKTNERQATAQRLRFLLVSKLFHRLALPYLYRYPIIGWGSLPQFTRCLTNMPSLGAYVHELDLRDVRHLDPDASARLASILRHTPHLKRLVGNGGVRMPFEGLHALAETASATLEELTGFIFQRCVDSDVNTSPNMLLRFTALRTLAWHGSHSPVSTPFFDAGDAAAPADGLPALEFFSIKSAETLPVFSQMELPNLRRVSLQMRIDDPSRAFTATAALLTFLRVHGDKLWTLRTNQPLLNGVPALILCPNMSVFGCRVDFRSDYDLGASALDPGFRHTYLTMLVLSRDASTHTRREEEAWANIFRELEKALPHFPALREVRALACEWPTTEHAISKSVWVQAAEHLLGRGIKLKDKGGVEWHPRLKAGRR